MRTLSTTPTKTTSANELNRDRSGILQCDRRSCRVRSLPQLPYLTQTLSWERTILNKCDRLL
ncbi:hypothetical protein NIES2100_43550 [Calothrix sp. NIES-2100]|uniref:hypothetical protein n=1 Tax=Calothrix sp. NIES-2100 TaxID=1954172 RepID=UPI000B60D208|nr:hypothetical protein NIES2100_43550 [Calothrix sp. NIES-2100]